MRTAQVIEILTPRNVLLNGLWFGSTSARRVYIWVHGLGSSAFSKLSIVEKLIEQETSVLTFNNRGHDGVARVQRLLKNGKTKYEIAGSAHENFHECIDDIQGAINIAKSRGASEVILIGHSTGCQKSILYAAQKKADRSLKGVILLAPVSDYAGALKRHGKKKLDRIARYARSLVKRGKPHQLIPYELWSEEPVDAQRFLSLYTPESNEEIFCYAQNGKNPAALKKVKVPILALWASEDEYADRPSDEVVNWFAAHLEAASSIQVVPGMHSFKGVEEDVAGHILRFLKTLSNQDLGIS